MTIRTKSFITASFRRREHPVVWNIDGTEVRLKAAVDIAQIAELLDGLQADPPEGLTTMEGVVWRQKNVFNCVSPFIVDEDRDAWAGLEASLDSAVLGEMAQELIGEYTGTNPTKAQSSSDGSAATGPTSTAGAVPEASTPSDSLPTGQ